MIPGIAAREVVVAALGTVYAVSASSEDAVQNALIPIIHNNWGLPTAFAFLLGMFMRRCVPRLWP